MGYEDLVNAIFQQAVEDYVFAHITRNRWEKRSIEKFLCSGAYGRDPLQGEVLIRKLKDEMSLVENFVDEFLDSDKKKILINPKMIAVNILRQFVKVKYQKLELVYEKTKGEKKKHLFLCKK